MTDFIQASFDGIALGAQYALIVLGFVVIYRATGIINFAQGGALLLGAYLTYNGTGTWGWNFYPALLFSIVATAAFSILLQRVMLQRVFRELCGAAVALLMWAIFVYNGWPHVPAFGTGVVLGVGAWLVARAIEARHGSRGPSELPVFGAIMVTVGVLFAIKQVVPSIWGFAELSLADPWEIDTSIVGGVVLSHAKIASLVMAGVALLVFFLIDRYSKIGIAMRAIHSDHEAAVAQGISTKVVFAVAFGIAGATAALAGTAAGSGSALLTPNLDLVVFLAFPAMILGGFDSPVGAVLGGILIGWFQNLVRFYVARPPDWFPIDDIDEVLGAGFDRVAVFISMIIVLMVKPYGMFGTEEVQRV